MQRHGQQSVGCCCVSQLEVRWLSIATFAHGLLLARDHLLRCAQKLHWDTADEKHWKDLSLSGT